MWGFVTKLLDNKDTVGLYQAVQLGIDYNSSTEAITKSVAIADQATRKTAAELG
jgi:hypothetical protein